MPPKGTTDMPPGGTTYMPPGGTSSYTGPIPGPTRTRSRARRTHGADPFGLNPANAATANDVGWKDRQIELRNDLAEVYALLGTIADRGVDTGRRQFSICQKCRARFNSD